MSFKKTLFMGLVGCTMLAGCNGSDDKADTPDTSSTFEELNDSNAMLAGTVEQLQMQIEEKAAADKTEKEAEARLDAEAKVAADDRQKQVDGKFADAQAALDALQRLIDDLQTRLTTTEKDAQGFKDMNLNQLKDDVSSLQDRMTTTEGDIAGLSALSGPLSKLGDKIADLEKTTLTAEELAAVKALDERFNTLKTAFDTEVGKRLQPADLDDLKAKIAALESGKVDRATLEALKTEVENKQNQLADASKLGATATEDFKKRIAELEDAVRELMGLRTDIAGLTQFVNPFVGTFMSESGGGHSGNVNPGAQTPFGMVSFGPDTKGSGSGYGYGSGGYYYTDTTIQYFSMTHLNGPGCRGQGAVALMPQVTSSAINLSGAGYSHANESAEPGYYKVKFNNNITTELTATTRTGMARFTYPDATKAFLIIDPARNNGNKSGVSASSVDLTLGADNQSLSGQSIANPFCGASRSQPVYFYAVFDKKLKNATPVTNKVATLQFDLTDADKSVLLKVGISSVSAANAKANLDAENPGWTFDGEDGLKTKASKDWNHRLNTIQVDLAKPAEFAKLTSAQQTSATTNLKKFYTAFYHVYSGPTVYSDVNGDYRSMQQPNTFSGAFPPRVTENVSKYPFKVDGKDAGYKTHYSGFSMWDTYRSQAQLVALVAPDEASDMMQSLVADAQQCGAFPHWVDGSEDTTPMEGDHAPNVIGGSYVFGARKFDLENARKFMKQSAFDRTSKCNDKSSAGTGKLAAYLTSKYLPAAMSDHASSNTLEMVTTDRSIGAFLAALPLTAESDQGDIAGLFDRAGYWKNIFDGTAGQMNLRAKTATGAWVSGEFHEAEEANYIWSFAQDWTALIDKLGGKAKGIERLNRLFSIPESTPFTGMGTEPTGPQLNSGEGGNTYYIGNEMAFATPWAYNWAGSPKHAQYIIPVIMKKNFSLNAGGLPGNDDMGATSSWYVWSALGLYPVIPSAPGMAVSTPQFSGITVWLGNGKKLRIETDKQAMLDNVRYITEMKLGDTVYQGSWLPLDKIRDGGTLTYKLSATPTEWGAAPELTPPSGPSADYSKPTATQLPVVQLVQ